jgi:hypothetical protein
MLIIRIAKIAAATNPIVDKTQQAIIMAKSR